MTPEATLWAEAVRLALVACPETPWTPESIAVWGGKHPVGCVCGSTGEVRSDVYRAIEMAVTVPNPDYEKYGEAWRQYDPEARPMRVVRPQPGVMACPEPGRALRPATNRNRAVCPDCGTLGAFENMVAETHGTVPDPSEAGVVARDEAVGRLWGVRRVIAKTPLLAATTASMRLYEALLAGSYPGVLAATLEAVRALAAQGAEA